MDERIQSDLREGSPDKSNASAGPFVEAKFEYAPTVRSPLQHSVTEQSSQARASGEKTPVTSKGPEGATKPVARKRGTRRVASTPSSNLTANVQVEVNGDSPEVRAATRDLAIGEGQSSVPRPAAVGAYAPVGVKLSEFNSTKQTPPRVPTNLPRYAVRRQFANDVPGIAKRIISAQIDGLIPKGAHGAVTQELKDFRTIENIRAELLALQATTGSVQSQLQYKLEFERQASELARTGRTKEDAKESGSRRASNSIEPSHVSAKEVELRFVSKGPEAQRVKPAPSSFGTRGLGGRLLSTAGSIAQIASSWFPRQRKSSEGIVSVRDERVISTSVKDNPSIDSTKIVPETVIQRYLRVEQEYYFKDKTPAFSDRGSKLATRSSHPEVVASLIEIAIARGWDSITVKGTAAFRRNTWLEAAQNGLRVSGYKPTSLELAALANRPASNSLERDNLSRKVHAAAAHEEALRLQTEHVHALGKTGTDSKERALQVSGPHSELAKKAKAFERNKPAFVIKKYPDLVGAYGVVEAAKTFAAEKLSDPAREEFVGMARRHVMQKILAGDPVQGPKIYKELPEKVVFDPKAVGVTAKYNESRELKPEKEVVKDR